MILIAAAAMASALYRAGNVTLHDLEYWKELVVKESYAMAVLTLAVPIAAPLSAAMVILRMRPPRPPGRRLARQPGLIACSTASGCALVVGCFVGLMAVFEARVQPQGTAFELGIILTPFLSGPAVLATELTLLFNRRLQPERSWIDRCGRAIGGFWIAALGVAFWYLWKV
jgi:hypothetical protein